MKLPLDPISPKVGCGWIITCLLAQQIHPTGESSGSCTHKEPAGDFVIVSTEFTLTSHRANTCLVFSATTSFVKSVPLQDSITTWQFIGISLSRTHGKNSLALLCDRVPPNLRREHFHFTSNPCRAMFVSCCPLLYQARVQLCCCQLVSTSCYLSICPC